MPKDDGNRLKAVELAKRLLVDAIWKTANIEVDGITFPDAQEIFEGRAPSNMEVNDIIVVNNIKRAWMFLFENIGRPIDWRYVSEYNRILGEGLIRDAGKLRTNDVRIGGTDRIPELPTMESSHDEISSLMKIESPEDRALLMFCKITRGQWFNDGNKRTALMTANHALINAGAAGKVEKDATVMLNVTGGGEEHFKEGKELWYLKPSHVFPLEPDTDDVVAKVEALFN